MSVILVFVHHVLCSSAKNAAVVQLLELLSATKLSQGVRYLLVINPVVGRRTVEGIGAMNGAALFLILTIVPLLIGIHICA